MMWERWSRRSRLAAAPPSYTWQQQPSQNPSPCLSRAVSATPKSGSTTGRSRTRTSATRRTSDSSPARSRWWWRQPRSGWASTSPTSAASFTTGRQRRLKSITSTLGARAATGWTRSALSTLPTPTSSRTRATSTWGPFRQTRGWLSRSRPRPSAPSPPTRGSAGGGQFWSSLMRLLRTFAVVAAITAPLLRSRGVRKSATFLPPPG
mmetsp:Transcript_18616/g.44847  ORF Transcript_18616/g.44847 Transcript_18616/m.44847 type:complete len:207 (-) Transcript_18616:829-1449(-)